MGSADRGGVSWLRSFMKRMRDIVACAAVLGAAHGPGALWGQTGWQVNGTTIYASAGTNVGIGTTSPDGPLTVQSESAAGGVLDLSLHLRDTWTHSATGLWFDGFRSWGLYAAGSYDTTAGGFKIYDFSANADRVVVDTSGNVGIGTTAPNAKLQVQTADDTAPTLIGAWDGRHAAVTNGAGGLGVSYSSNNNTGYISVLTPGVAWGNLVLQAWANSGNVGIGTTAPQYKLAVNGTVGAREVIVTNTGWADYVLKPGYRLRPLGEVAEYIREHKTLPDMPSEEEVREKGVSLGEVQVKLLAKIEELTLHMIEADARNDRLEKQNARLGERNERLARQNKELEGRTARLEALSRRQ